MCWDLQAVAVTVRCHSPGTRDGDDVSAARADPGEGQLPRRDPLLLGDALDCIDERHVMVELLLLEAGEVVAHIAS